MTLLRVTGAMIKGVIFLKGLKRLSVILLLSTVIAKGKTVINELHGKQHMEIDPQPSDRRFL